MKPTKETVDKLIDLVKILVAVAFTVWIIVSPYSGWWILLVLIILSM